MSGFEFLVGAIVFVGVLWFVIYTAVKSARADDRRSRERKAGA